MQLEIEKWIECNQNLYKMVNAESLRAFLAQYVLCEKEPVAWRAIGESLCTPSFDKRLFDTKEKAENRAKHWMINASAHPLYAVAQRTE